MASLRAGSSGVRGIVPRSSGAAEPRERSRKARAGDGDGHALRDVPFDQLEEPRARQGALAERARDERVRVGGIDANVPQDDEVGAWADRGEERLHVVLDVGEHRGFEARGFEAFQDRFAVRDALQGLSVVLSDGTQGVASGVSRQGALQVQTASGCREVTSAEVSVRPC